MRIADHVDNDLSQARDITTHGRQIWRDVDLDSDSVLRELVTEKRDRSVNHLGEVDLSRLVLIMTREGQETTHNLCNAPAFIDDAVDHLALKIRAFYGFVFKKLREVYDAVEWVIDFVGHAGRKLAERSEFG